MSAADRWLNNKPFFGHVITLTISMIVVFTTYALNRSDFKENEINERINLKADIEYVDKSIKNHEDKEEIMFNNIEGLLKSYIESNEKIIKRIDSRMDRMESKIDEL